MEKNLSLLLSPKHLNYFETMTFIVLQFKAGHESLEIKVASNKWMESQRQSSKHSVGSKLLPFKSNILHHRSMLFR
jgi:hypothetical protein